MLGDPFVILFKRVKNKNKEKMYLKEELLTMAVIIQIKSQTL